MGLVLTAGGMLYANTPVEDYRAEYGLLVKREDLACPPPGPPFSKTRGVYAHIASRPEKLIGVLDTSHSQAGHAVARACQVLGKQCINFYPVYKRELRELDDGDPPRHELRLPQIRSQELGAELHALPAGRSCILFHTVKRLMVERGGYAMPNALQIPESVTETAKEVPVDLSPDLVLIPASSGTIAAGVMLGFERQGKRPTYVIHLGYSRSHKEVATYLREASGVNVPPERIRTVDEGYSYADQAEPGPTPPWPCNPYYDLKAFRWWMRWRYTWDIKLPILWNIG